MKGNARTLGLVLVGMLGGCAALAQQFEPAGNEGFVLAGAPVDWWGRDVADVERFRDPLARHGRWLSHPRFRMVFLPHGVSPGWQPYARGYWRDDPDYGRFWISDEPFGWATYHYGRWAFDPRLGWFWVPDGYFGPGWVDWRQTSGHWRWAPLPPRGWAYDPWGWNGAWRWRTDQRFAYPDRWNSWRYRRHGHRDHDHADDDHRPRKSESVRGAHPRSSHIGGGRDQDAAGRHPRSAAATSPAPPIAVMAGQPERAIAVPQRGTVTHRPAQTEGRHPRAAGPTVLQPGAVSQVHSSTPADPQRGSIAATRSAGSIDRSHDHPRSASNRMERSRASDH